MLPFWLPETQQAVLLLALQNPVFYFLLAVGGQALRHFDAPSHGHHGVVVRDLREANIRGRRGSSRRALQILLLLQMPLKQLTLFLGGEVAGINLHDLLHILLALPVVVAVE